MENNRLIKISSAGNRKSVSWMVQELWWSEFVEKLKIPVRCEETLQTYMRLPKSEQDELKDVGGFVGGELRGARKAINVKGRDLITLDLDNIPSEGTQNVLRVMDSLGCGFAVYSTRKHEAIKPRLRVIVPLDETATADEYEPLARKLAEMIGIELADPTTFQVSRLMYYPSASSDSDYIFSFADKPFLSKKGMLGLYQDWKDVSSWPKAQGETPVKKMAEKQGDPLSKKGIVGAFCNTYDIENAIEIFLPDAYLDCDIKGRLTYAKGSTTGGVILYEEGNFLYSHHATDPCGGRLVNSFDLVRLHKFGELDEEVKVGTPVSKMPSYTAMMELAKSDDKVMDLLKQSKYETAVAEFGAIEGEQATGDSSWLKQLKLTSTGSGYEKSTHNIVIILKNDPRLKGKFAFDEFGGRGLVLGSLPWKKKEEIRLHEDIDDSGIRWYMETIYGITGKEKVYDALALVALENSHNQVKEYLNNVEWDGVKRLDTVFIDYLGAEDNQYVRAVTRKSLTAAVARVFSPGIKYDQMTILAGKQGIGKSTLLRLLGKDWYSDSLVTFEGKEAAEMIQGTWINELGELNGLSRSETNSVKQFLSKTEDIYREAYGRRTVKFPRRCVFFGTTNDSEFLLDRTGNRRFWPIDVGVAKPLKNVWEELPINVDQIWAEAVLAYRLGEKLFVFGELEGLAKDAQEIHRESNIKEGLIREYLSKPIPEKWSDMDINQRRLYILDDFGKGAEALKQRVYICAAEVWSECFGKKLADMRQSDSREINSILASLEGLNRMKRVHRFSMYGPQRGFEIDSNSWCNSPVGVCNTVTDEKESVTATVTHLKH